MSIIDTRPFISILNRIADAFERQAAAQERLVKLAEEEAKEPEDKTE